MQEQPAGPPSSNWQYTPTNQGPAPGAVVSGGVVEAAQQAPQTAVTADDSVSWTASEFIDHEKSGGWYALLIVGVLVFAVAVSALTKDIFSGVIIAIMGFAFAFFAARKPRTLPYVLDHDGLQIGPKHYAYTLFKSFSVIDEGTVRSITLMPLKRFMPPISIFYDPKDEQTIASVISTHLPFEPGDLDPIERLMRRVRF